MYAECNKFSAFASLCLSILETIRLTKRFIMHDMCFIFLCRFGPNSLAVI
jgi:hypothetical protein